MNVAKVSETVRRTSCPVLFVLVSFLMLLELFATERLFPTVEVTVADRLGVPRVGESVCSGIPFSRGTLRPETEVRIEDGAVHTSAGVCPERIDVEETGPIRATVRVVGWLEAPKGERLYKLDTRLRFYAGQGRWKVRWNPLWGLSF